MKMIIKDTDGSVRQVEVENGMNVDVQPGQQIFVTGANKSDFSTSDDNQDMSLHLVDENGEKITIELPGMAGLVASNDPTDPFGLTTALGVSTTAEGDAEIDKIVNNPELEIGQIIDQLKEALAQSNSGADKDGTVIDDFGSMTEALTASAADATPLSNTKITHEETTDSDLVKNAKARSSRY